ncbi:H(+)/Pi cotransporter [Intoshia linei]|uniref:H(+)/Pi cotransporter n=1 Tax=Intoshia linei TaxID=1819745 RepID=A0A177B2W4_9BILA|nr:H(+)/Pi cotransporter [Intoshia linei]
MRHLTVHLLNFHLLLSVFSIYIGTSFQFGYNIGSLNPIKKHIENFYFEQTNSSSKWYFTICTAIGVFGTIIGGMCVGYLSDTFGRKRTVMISQIVGVIGGVIQYLSYPFNSYWILPIGRLITGWHCGIGAQIAPMYVSEFSPFKIRGVLVTVHQLMITFGIVVASLYGLDSIFGTKYRWSYLLLMNIVPSIVCLIMMIKIPESPRYLMITKNDEQKATKSMQFYRESDNVKSDIDEMSVEIKTSKLIPEFKIIQLFTSRNLLIPLIMAVSMQYIQQLSGINMIFFYSHELFSGIISKNYIQYAILLTSIINMIAVIPSVFLTDKLGRKPLIFYPIAGMIICMSIVCTLNSYITPDSLNGIAKEIINSTNSILSIFSITFILIYVILFEFGLGPIPFILGSELFTQGPRSTAMSISGFSNSLFTLLVSIIVPPIQEKIGEKVFIIFIINCAIFNVIFYFFFPETKNKSFEEISKIFSKKDRKQIEN